MKHKHYNMIVAKAENMDLVVFRKINKRWEQITIDTIPTFYTDIEYFLCLPQYKEACLHWLNGGDIEWLGASGCYYHLDGISMLWSTNFVLMRPTSVVRIKPKKEKFWIAVYIDGTVCNKYKTTKNDIAAYVERSPYYCHCAPEDWQFLEIEMAVEL